MSRGVPIAARLADDPGQRGLAAPAGAVNEDGRCIAERLTQTRSEAPRKHLRAGRHARTVTSRGG